MGRAQVCHFDVLGGLLHDGMLCVQLGGCCEQMFDLFAGIGVFVCICVFQ